jgi:16S rRNA (cytidine1402-2'-O)-methyltransferase
MPVLYVIATPLGNLGDITLRAVQTLQEVDLVAAEDTRHSLGLLNHLHIKKPLMSCRSQNENSAAEKIIHELSLQHNVAFITDAGTPGISDPGARLVQRVRSAGYQVIPIPGPSAITALASVAGLPGKRLIFDGFLSPKPGKRKKQLKELLEQGENCIVYESPFRIVKLLKDARDLDPSRPVVVGRELTKTYEEILTGTVEEVLHILEQRTTIKGEIAVMFGKLGDLDIDDSGLEETP